LSDSLLLENFQCSQNQINSLNLGDKPALSTFYCDFNPITSINPQLFPNIEWLDCSNTLITTIDLHGLNLLTSLELNSTLLSEIDCSQTGLWYHLYCSDNPNLTSINVHNNYVSFGDPDLLDFPFRFDDLPNIANICMDDGEQNNLLNTLYNSNIGVQIFGGTNCDVLLSANSNTIEDSMVLYPNPAINTININVASGVIIESIAVYNPLGQLVKTLVTSELNSSLSIDVSALKTGTYFMEITSNNGKTTKKFVKL
jgi:Secretion system C-terminal sorting domain